MNIFSSHPSFEQLVDLVEGRMPLPEQDSLFAHVSTCSRCAAEKARLERLIELMRTDTGEDAPPAVIARAQRLFQPRSQSTAAPRRHILAQLFFDSRQQPLALGVRSEQPTAHQLLLRAEAYDLDLRLTPTDAAWQISGQVLGPAIKGQVELQGQAGLNQAQLSELGEFALPPISPGYYQLTLRLSEVEIEFPPLEIGL